MNNLIKRSALSLCLLGSLASCSPGGVKGLEKWLGKNKRGNLYQQAFARQALSPEEAKQAAALIYAAKQQETIEKNKNDWDRSFLSTGDKRMFFSYKIFGDKPAGGRSLYISMHGGGNTAKQVNDQQWRNQSLLYQPAEGVYFTPRAAVDDWNMWFQPHVDTLFNAIIQMAVATLDVNPDKVYLMGYSAGGDGAYRMAPRMADRWAAASMMAGHPGDVSALSLRNIGFSLWMGALDGAYDRNQKAEIFKGILDSLHTADPEGYTHDVHIVEGKPHWMDRVDTVALPWMAQFTRNPYPGKVVWKQDNIVPYTSFYWLAIPAHEAAPAREAIVQRQGNTFTIVKNDYNTLSIGMNDAMIDYAQPVTVISNGTTLFSGPVTRSIGNIYYSIQAKGDKQLVFDTYLTIKNGKATEGIEP